MTAWILSILSDYIRQERIGWHLRGVSLDPSIGNIKAALKAGVPEKGIEAAISQHLSDEAALHQRRAIELRKEAYYPGREKQEHFRHLALADGYVKLLDALSSGGIDGYTSRLEYPAGLPRQVVELLARH